MKSIHDLLGMSLITVQEGTRLGTLQGVEIDTAKGRVRYLCFDGAETRADGVLPWSAVQAVGKDAITVDTVGSILEAVPVEERDQVTLLVGNRPVMTVGGTRLGNITGYDLDETTGRIESYHVATGGFFGRLVNSERTFPHATVRTLGPDAIVVTDEVANSRAGAAK